jgi:hypothetical protein
MGDRLKNPYPESVFPPYSEKELEMIAIYLQAGGYSPSRYNGCWGRQVWNNAIEFNNKQWIEEIEKFRECNIAFTLKVYRIFIKEDDWQSLKNKMEAGE